MTAEETGLAVSVGRALSSDGSHTASYSPRSEATVGETPRTASRKKVMRKFITVSAIGLGLLLGQVLPTSADVPDGVIELSGGSVAAGIGFRWGSGTLIFQGKRYPLKISGFSLASVGVTDYTAAGNVTGLRTAQDINGVFTSVAAGGTLGGGGNIAAMRNQNGVVIQMTSTTAGLSLTLAAEGVKISIAN
jgi:hypothetical protein